MNRDTIAEVMIDETGRLHVVPSTRSFPYIYREAMEVGWDDDRRSLHSPTPREWSYSRWFQQILEAAREQGWELQVVPSTTWRDIDPDTKADLLRGTNDAV